MTDNVGGRGIQNPAGPYKTLALVLSELSRLQCSTSVLCVFLFSQHPLGGWGGAAKDLLLVYKDQCSCV